MLPWALRNTLLLSYIAAPLMIYLLYKTLSAAEESGWFGFDRLKSSRYYARWPLVVVLFLIINIYPFCLQAHAVFGGIGSFDIVRAIRVGEPWVYGALVYPYWTIMMITGQIAPLLLAAAVLKIPFYRIRNRHAVRWRRIESRLVIGIIALGACYVGGRIYHDTQTVTVTERDVFIRNLPAALDGFRIAHISDLQADQLTGDRLMQQYVDTVNGTQADLVCFTGDLVTRGTDYIPAGARMLGRMRATHGVYACLGDHDVWSDAGWITTALHDLGVGMLDNKHHLIDIGNARLLLTGATNTYSRRISNRDVAALEQQRPQADASVFMAHQHAPRIVQAVADQGYDLFLGGHTHGGQVVVTVFGMPVTPVLAETPYLAGFYEIGDMLMSVNNGLGLTLAPIRFQAPAEVTVLTLKRANSMP